MKQEVKANIKEEVKIERSAPFKRPRSISGEVPIRKRIGATTAHAQAALKPAVEEDEGPEQLETLEELLGIASEVGDGEV